MLVKDLLRPPEALVTVTPKTFVHEAAELLSKFRIGLLLVLDDAKNFAGVISERDIVAALGKRIVNVDLAKVGDLMTKSVVTIDPQNSLTHAASAMKENGIRHLVAMEQEKPVGIVSIRDVLSAFASDLIKNGEVSDSNPAREFVEAMASYRSAGGLSIKV